MNNPLNYPDKPVVATGPDADGYTEYMDSDGAIIGWTYKNGNRVRTELRVRGLSFEELFWVTFNVALTESEGHGTLNSVTLARWLLGAMKDEHERVS